MSIVILVGIKFRCSKEEWGCMGRGTQDPVSRDAGPDARPSDIEMHDAVPQTLHDRKY